MAHNPDEETVTISGDNETNMEIELLYFFQEVKDSEAQSFKTFKMTPRVPERFPEDLVKKALDHPRSETHSELDKQFYSRITKVMLKGFTQDTQCPDITFKTNVGEKWEIKIFFDHPKILSEPRQGEVGD